VKKWVITIAAGVVLLALMITFPRWFPILLNTAVHDKDKAEALKTLLETIALPVGWLATAVTFIYGFWQKKKEDVGVNIGGQGPTSVSGQVAGRDAIGRDAVGRDRVEMKIGTAYFQTPPGAGLPSPATFVPSFSPLHQLPPPPADFTGREDELKELLTAVATGGVTISGLQGQGGVGKTALALKVAEKLSPNFPDAQIYMDLLGVSTKPLTAGEAMAYVIRAFQREAKLPEKEQELSAIYQSVLHGKRALLLMDNARDGPQVGPLIPPAGCVLLVTSRFHFHVPGLGAKNLDTLPPAKARELLLKIAPRIDGEAEEIARLCGYLPQALRLAGSALVERVNISPADYRQRLAEEKNRPQMLAAGNESVEASISLSYGMLDAETQKRWRMLSVFPETFDGTAVATAWSAEKNSANDTLGLLTQYSMLEWNEKTERYRLHDLMRDFARGKLGDEERYEASLRHARHYLETVWRADELYKKGGDCLMSGLALFDLERGNIEEGQAWAAEGSAKDDAAAEACNDYPNAGAYCLGLRQHARECIAWLEAGLKAARRLGKRDHEGNHLGNLGIYYLRLGDCRRAIGYHEQHLKIAREIGDQRGEGIAMGNLGADYRRLGEYQRAIECYGQALKIAREIGNKRGEGNALGNLGGVYQSLGEYRRGIEFCEKQLQIVCETGDRQGESNALGSLGVAYRSLGEYMRATCYFEQSLGISREIGDRWNESTALGNLANVYLSLGDYRQAIECHGRRLEIAREIGDLHGEGTSLGGLGIAHKNLGEFRRAIEYHEKHLKVVRQIGDREGEGAALGNLGVAYRNLGELRTAVEYYEQQLQIAREIGDRYGECNSLFNISLAVDATGDRREAIRLAEASLKIREEIEDPFASAVKKQLEEWRKG